MSFFVTFHISQSNAANFKGVVENVTRILQEI